ncbi:MarR family winged helix-turn-helix transcriptional regulator [Microvirga calopogonii]|uniref:MarR family winged helix-turn-helix transcriptional regulator n=1 Tax=Microvirga calopogonii TaxID=2078013 RepID=UPI0013B3B826|nr:MarR family winged helix-turn-helix transcriptional regulator [Microvirga calopogonii]
MTEQKSAIVVFSRFLTAAREIHPFIEIQQVQILLEIARKPLSTMKELADATDVALSSISRNLDALGDEHRKGTPGMGLVAKDRDPREPRRMVAWLTPKGKEVVKGLLEAVGPS